MGWIYFSDWGVRTLLDLWGMGDVKKELDLYRTRKLTIGVVVHCFWLELRRKGREKMKYFLENFQTLFSLQTKLHRAQWELDESEAYFFEAGKVSAETSIS